MASQLYQDLRDQVAVYLSDANRIPLHKLEEESLDVLWNHDDDHEAVELAGSIQLLTSELGLGDRTLDSLKEELAHAIRGVYEPAH